jgi:transcription elongation GreA/GreB family factor
MDYQIIKEELYKKCVDFIERAITTSQEAMKEAQNAANSETKSSVGDKYETTRAMMQIEKENKAKQLADALKVKQVLDKLNLQKAAQVVSGSLVLTNQGNFFIAISAGKIEIENQVFFAISTASPIGEHLYGKAQDEEFTFQKKIFKILAIE